MSSSNYDRRTALHLAAAEGHSSCVKFLVDTCHLSPLTKDRFVYFEYFIINDKFFSQKTSHISNFTKLLMH